MFTKGQQVTIRTSRPRGANLNPGQIVAIKDFLGGATLVVADIHGSTWNIGPEDTEEGFQSAYGAQQAAAQMGSSMYAVGTVSALSPQQIRPPQPNPFFVAFDDPKPAVKKTLPKKPVAKISLSSVVMSKEKKEEIESAISQVKNNEQIFSKWGFADVFEKGTAISLLFWGIPGTGKTLTAQAIADETSSSLKVYGTAEIESAEPGGAERTMKQIFAEAKRANKTPVPRLILFDECDSLLMDRNEVGPILSAQVNTLLSEIEHYDGIIIFTTNRMGKLDPALERRLSAKIEFTFPDKVQRLAIWERMIPKKAPLAKDVNFKKLAEYPIAGGNIKNAVLNAARFAAYKKAKAINMSHFKNAIEKEASSLQAFADQYEKQSHSSIVGYSRGTHGVTLQKDEIKSTITKQLTRGSAWDDN